MKIIAANDYNDMSRKAANLLSAQIIMKPDCVLGLATGSSPVGTYKQLIEWYRKGDLDFSEVTTVNLDEYKGLPRTDPQSYYAFMRANLFDHINIHPERTHIPDGTEADSAKACGDYNAILRRLGGVDMQLLGLGHNGHIGFNEPDKFFTAATHEVVLDESTIEANARFFEKKEDVPTTAITMGMMSIMQAKKVLLIANGAKKKEIVEKSFFGPITPAVPASILQLHPDVTVIFAEE